MIDKKIRSKKSPQISDQDDQSAFLVEIPAHLKDKFESFMEKEAKKEDIVPVQVRVAESTKNRWKAFVDNNERNIKTMAKLIRDAVEYFIVLDDSTKPFEKVMTRSWLLREIVMNLISRIQSDESNSKYVRHTGKFNEIANDLLNLILSIEDYENKRKAKKNKKK